MDEASYKARDEHHSRIDEPKRSACLKRLVRVVEKATVWVQLASAASPSPSDAKVLGACWDLQAVLGVMRGHAGAGLRGVAVPVREFARSRLQPLFDAEKP
jgi:hypothetical protein